MQKHFRAERLDEYLAELDGLEEKVSGISIPLAYSLELYDLRLHIDMLRKKLRVQVQAKKPHRHRQQD